MGSLSLAWLLRFHTPSQSCRRDRSPRTSDLKLLRKSPVSPPEAPTALTCWEQQPRPWHVSWGGSRHEG